MINMDFDDDAPPELVDTTAVEEDAQEISVKVPITIVTGIFRCGIEDAIVKLGC